MATKYVSALDGGQMDSALMDMATHTSEAWAVGTRNGTPVSGSDVTYHNNSKYWADSVYGYTERAEDAAARAEAAVPAGTAGAVFFDRAQSLTTAQQMQAKANISAGGTNPNLLDNPWFTVNQRSAGSTSDGYPADRWLKVGNTAATATATANGLVIALNGSGYCDLRNRYSEAEIITPNLGKTATISAMLVDGTVFSDQIILSTTQQDRYLNSGKIRFNLSVSGGVYLVRLVLYDDMTIRAVKLELGSVSTLANDAPPDYYKELDKCQWYFERIKAGNTSSDFGIGVALSTTAAAFLVNMHPKRNNQYTVVTSGVFGTTPGGTINSLAVDRAASNGVLNLYATGTFVANSPYILRSANDANVYIDINNDL